MVSWFVGAAVYAWQEKIWLALGGLVGGSLTIGEHFARRRLKRGRWKRGLRIGILAVEWALVVGFMAIGLVPGAVFYTLSVTSSPIITIIRSKLRQRRQRRQAMISNDPIVIESLEKKAIEATKNERGNIEGVKIDIPTEPKLSTDPKLSTESKLSTQLPQLITPTPKYAAVAV